MAKIIFTSRYLSNAPKKQLKNFVNYMATRPGVELSSNGKFPATEKQIKFIDTQAEQYPEIKSSFEYEDYQKNPTIANASELISAIAEKYMDDSAYLKNYVDYIAHRPRAERSSQGHGLWSGTNQPITLSKVAEEVANHKGNVWTHVISLRREDAQRLGYDNADAWRELVKSKIPVIADSMKIPIDQLKWYGAFHDAENHPHIHMLVYSEDTKKGYLNKNGIEKMRQTFGTAIFHDDLMHVYAEKDEVRKTVKDIAEKKMKELTAHINQRDTSNPVIASLLLELSKELRQTKGKKQYGWLDTKKKQMVNAVVSELGRDKDIQELYRLWCDLKNEVARTYQTTPPPCGRLDDEPNFKMIKNLIIQYAMSIGEFDQENEETEISVFSETETNAEINIPHTYELLMQEAEKGNCCAFYDLGMLFLKGKGVERNITLAQEYFEKALAGFMQQERFSHTDFLQYRIGKMYLMGQGTQIDIPTAIEYLNKSAASGNIYALFSLLQIHAKSSSQNIDIQAVIEKLTQVAEADNGFAQYALGYFYTIDKQGRDSQKALFWLEKSIANNNTMAQSLIDYNENFSTYLTPFAATINLFRDMGKIIENDFYSQQKQIEQLDRKILRKIAQKKAALGQKQTLD